MVSIPSISERRYRLCMWQVLLEDGRISYNHCVHLDGEFNVCKINRPQFAQREQHSREFSDKHGDNDYSMDEWKQILNEHQKEQGTLYPCDSNISGAEVDEMLHTQVSIPCISERMYRTCDSCVWWEYDGWTCEVTQMYTMTGERTDPCINNKTAMPLPCRFHMTPDEMKQILDPYFM